MTLQDAISGFLVEQQIRGNSERTVVFYRSCLSKAALFLGSDSSLADLSLPQKFQIPRAPLGANRNGGPGPLLAVLVDRQPCRLAGAGGLPPGTPDAAGGRIP